MLRFVLPCPQDVSLDEIDNMKEDQQTVPLVRLYILATLIAVLVWQVYLSFIAFYRVPPLLILMIDFIDATPATTKLLFKTNYFFWIAPVVSLALVIDVTRRKRVPALYASCLLVIMIVIGYSMHFLIYEGVFGPIWEMSKALE